MKITDDMLKKALDTAIAYANKHVNELAEEILEWKDTSVLRQGRLRDLAKIVSLINGRTSLELAKSLAERAALEQAGRRTTPDRDAIIEECARAIDKIARANPCLNDKDLLRNAIKAIRALKTTPTAAEAVLDRLAENAQELGLDYMTAPTAASREEGNG
ncbi:hypothetical protein WJ95_09570 [Burkholderia ubonensis]|uniref:hypothetical protein n=1 Tax=Burkholderia ubonensis TaxID=101571 RepID=UPI00075ECCF6|nr:hypothetical protein [Burkholderia ubonensis]KVP90741.1 hypothetical protein WJ95_09570 [Burkholderia ubonensis]